MPPGDKYKYKISDVKPKNGRSLRYIHYEVLGRFCSIVKLNIGEKAVIEYESPYVNGDICTLHTSSVENYMTHNGEESITIETKNTIYVLDIIKNSCDKF